MAVKLKVVHMPFGKIGRRLMNLVYRFIANYSHGTYTYGLAVEASFMVLLVH